MPKSRFNLLQTGLIYSLGAMIALSTVQPAHAWWFFPDKPTTSIQPKHTSGLILSPLIADLLPSFILEPLQKTTVEQPPVVQTQQPQLILQPLIKSPSVPDSNGSIGEVAQQVLDQVNRVRQQNNLPSLLINLQLTKSAQQYAEQMSRQRFFSHTSPSGQTFRQRNEQAGYTNWQWMGENIAQGQTSVTQVINDWLNSEAHRQNILSPKAKELGVGYVAGHPSFWVQEFGLQFE